MSQRFLPPRRWTIGALVGVGLVVAIGFIVAPHWSTRYGAGLIAFSIWMVWFVVVARRWIDDADF